VTVNDLIEFLAARLADDEQGAETSLRFVAEAKRIEAMDRRRTRNPASRWTLDMEARAKRTLAEVAAKRAIIESCAETLAHEDAHDYQLDGGTGEEYGLARYVLMQLGMSYRDHPNWREDWRA